MGVAGKKTKKLHPRECDWKKSIAQKRNEKKTPNPAEGFTNCTRLMSTLAANLHYNFNFLVQVESPIHSVFSTSRKTDVFLFKVGTFCAKHTYHGHW